MIFASGDRQLLPFGAATGAGLAREISVCPKPTRFPMLMTAGANASVTAKLPDAMALVSSVRRSTM